jgi:hypothetical protein
MAAARRPRRPGRRWSQEVTKHSDALDLEGGVFTQDDPRKIARSLKRSADHSRRRKSDPYRSAMSMLTVTSPNGGCDSKRPPSISSYSSQPGNESAEL